MFSFEPISCSIRSTCSLAPPCSGPYNAEAAAAIPEYGSRWREATPRLDHAHRMRVVVESIDELLDVLVDDRVVRDVIHPAIQLARRRQLAVQQQVGRLEERALLGELFDWVAAVAQDPLVPVDEADRAAARGRVHERRVVAQQPVVVRGDLDLAQVGRVDSAVLDRELVLLPGAVVDDRQGVLGHCGVLESGWRKLIESSYFGAR